MAQPPRTGPSSKMAAFWSRLSPVPAFPDYPGPYAVGSVDLELPVAALGPAASATAVPAEAAEAGVGTVLMRVFYPADAASAAAAPRVRWLPAPPRQYVSAYAQFLGVRARVADAVAYLPRHLHYAEMGVGADAQMAGGDGPDADVPRGDAAAAAAAADTPPRAWPVMVFSHGLGGSRNAYAHLAASVASHGVVVACPEHRDGSAVLTFVRGADRDAGSATTSIPFRRIPHEETPAAWAARDAQLRVRLWELGLVHEALVRLDQGRDVGNRTDAAAAAVVAQFAGRLDVHRPGAVAWAGHSFGAASVVQLVKTAFYGEDALYQAGPALRAQITAASPTVLLDVWCFPLQSPATRALLARPLPAWAAQVPGGPLLAVASESFVRWTEHLQATARVLAPDAATADHARLFYVARSAHLSQSDFGLVFPWLTRAVFKAPQPERALRLNVRAIVQLLRGCGVAVAGKDPEAEGDGDDDDGTGDDTAIFERRPGAVADWVWVDVAGLLGDASETGTEKTDTTDTADTVEKTDTTPAPDTEAAMEGELEPRLA